MQLQLPNNDIVLDKFIHVGETPVPTGLPTSLRDVNRMKSMNNYKDDPSLSAEENQKRKEQLARLEESIRNKKEYTKSSEQRAKEKKLAKLAAKSRKKNRK